MFFISVLLKAVSLIHIVLFIVEMGKFMKPGKVVMVLAGRYAGRKAVIVKVKQAKGLFVRKLYSAHF